MCSFGPDTVFALYTDDERPRETIRPRYDLEEGVYGIGLGILSNSLNSFLHHFKRRPEEPKGVGIFECDLVTVSL